MSKYNWTRQETKDLITLYEINECLWHKGLREYKDRDERISSIQSISDEMKIPIEEINKKIHNLRNQYRFELNKTRKIVPGKPRYQSKWPFFKNLSFLENIVCVRGSNSVTNNNNAQNEHSSDEAEMKLDEQGYEENNLTDKYNNNELATATATIVNGDQSPLQQQVQMQVQMQPLQPQQNQVVISVEYDDIKPKILNPEASNAQVSGVKGKRKLLAQQAIQHQQQQQLLNHYVTLQQSQIQQSPKHIPAIVIDETSHQPQKSAQVQSSAKEQTQDVSVEEVRYEIDEATPTKRKLASEADSFDVFGMLVANEMRSLTSNSLKKKMKRQILQIILEINGQDSESDSADK